MSGRGLLHHVELRTDDLELSSAAWSWLLGQLGYEPYQEWDGGRSWRLGSVYLVLEAAPLPGAHDRRMPGLSHLAFHAGSAAEVDQLWDAAPDHGWTHLYADRHPFAGGPGYYAAYLENGERFKVELVASGPMP
ncbi:glyoxalase/bleomycin resistance protein/dioxygenase superfamily protein [Cellulosimicrobium cellulans J34]|nr:glyoxalase/bleomycin resistance protein/dioxygenase superfamily protein [Cellulosimicrobium cellulans J34]SMF53670.1 Glyoxalase/Bleomycin resistance protein/Dioxygenase superfamily protein [Cellulosimicrobium cellulans J1]